MEKRAIGGGVGVCFINKFSTDTPKNCLFGAYSTIIIPLKIENMGGG
ncbi:MAG: hypothetical protein LUE27_05360 [Clostridia bacterium]|nr:hypothetical protein [Clostridia bacterium]